MTNGPGTFHVVCFRTERRKHLGSKSTKCGHPQGSFGLQTSCVHQPDPPRWHGPRALTVGHCPLPSRLARGSAAGRKSSSSLSFSGGLSTARAAKAFLEDDSSFRLSRRKFCPMENVTSSPRADSQEPTERIRCSNQVSTLATRII